MLTFPRGEYLRGDHFSCFAFLDILQVDRYRARHVSRTNRVSSQEDQTVETLHTYKPSKIPFAHEIG